MVIDLPLVPSVQYYGFDIVLAAALYGFDVRWNSRDAAWYLNIRDANRARIITGVKVVLGAYLGRRSNHSLFRDGVLVACDLTAKGKEATFTDLGERVVVRYVPVLDLMGLTS